MYILDVIPLTMIPRPMPQILSYFCDEMLPVGSVVEVTLNHRKINAVVIGSDTLKNRKLDFKKNVNFEIKNISKILSPFPVVSENQLRIASHIASYYYAPLGLSLKTVLPDFLLKKNKTESITLPVNKENKQTLILVPEKTYGKYLFEKYKDQNPVFISSETKLKEYKEIWQNVATGKAGLIIGTRIGLFLPFSNLNEIIVEDESNEAYKSDMTPRYNAVDLAGKIAEIYGAKIIYNAVVPRLETYFTKNIPSTISLKPKIIFMADEIKAGNFSILSRNLKKVLQENLESKENTIVYIPRRGHANFIYCQTCGKSVQCPNCSSSLVLHKTTTEELKCHHCGYNQNKPRQCPFCQSYALKSYGVGIEKVAEEVKRFLHYQNYSPQVFILSGDTAGNDKKEDEIIKNYQNTPGGILLATQKIFSYKGLLKPVKIVIMSADALIHIPDFRAEELLFRNIQTLASMASEILIQTYNPKDEALSSSVSGEDFLKKEIKNREALNYPPFSKLIKLSLSHKDNASAARNAKIIYEKIQYAANLEKLNQNVNLLGPYPSFINKQKRKYVWNILLKVNPELKTTSRNKLLNVVPAGWSVDVDPLSVI